MIELNKAIATSLFSIVSAQLLKVPLEYARTGRWNLDSIVTTGGMPSSHSAGVSSLAAYIGLKKGFKTMDFAIAAMMGLIVMYDAAGIRRHAGETAVAVNELENSIEKISEYHPEIRPPGKVKILKERLGHLPSEVVAGAVYGAAVGVISWALSKRS